MSSDRLESLDRSPVGTSSTLRRITSSQAQRRRLAELGFVRGARVRVVGRGGVRGLVLSVHDDVRVALDAATARQLWVTAGPAGV